MLRKDGTELLKLGCGLALRAFFQICTASRLELVALGFSEKRLEL